LAIEDLETFFPKKYLISSSFPSSLDFPKDPRGLPSIFPLSLAAANACLVLSDIKSLSMNWLQVLEKQKSLAK